MLNFCLVLLIGDSDNLIGLFEEDALFPLVLLAFASRHYLDVPAASQQTSSPATTVPWVGSPRTPRHQIDG